MISSTGRPVDALVPQLPGLVFQIPVQLLAQAIDHLIAGFGAALNIHLLDCHLLELAAGGIDEPFGAQARGRRGGLRRFANGEQGDAGGSADGQLRHVGKDCF